MKHISMQHMETFAATRETSIEIVQAIFELAAHGDESRMWESPTEDEFKSVVRFAWELADKNEDTLNWGVTHLTRELAA